MKTIKTYAVLILVSVAIILTLGTSSLQPSIHDATFNELLSVHDIGEVKANMIIEYLKDNPTCTIDELEKIKGIGAITVCNLKDKWD